MGPRRILAASGRSFCFLDARSVIGQPRRILAHRGCRDRDLRADAGETGGKGCGDVSVNGAGRVGSAKGRSEARGERARKSVSGLPQSYFAITHLSQSQPRAHVALATTQLSPSRGFGNHIASRSRAHRRLDHVAS